ncbi:hypothetical protein HHK36_030928 [Tetracentron sinense]|uniref:THO complex subunit 5 n=1 Tax=Tetracentron sinense TaxID=13715 RepID=A0A835D160_TETSI|nr:hypothetical protein HHK36_030928 [Tetracentron sinense]
MEVEDATLVLLPQQHKTENMADELLEESRISMEEIVAKMLFIKKEGRPKDELRELFTQMFLHFIHLRQANRSILLEEDHAKTETKHAKASVDFASLQLHKLMYEKNHYVKVIKGCKNFKSKQPDIEVVTEKEFFSSAPEEIKGTSLSNDSAHDLMLKRLNFELFQRKELCKLHEKLEQHKKSLLETIANRKKFMLSLPSHLKSLKKASLPVQQQLGVLHTKKLKQHHSAELLPRPLYVIYSQFLAQKEAFEEDIDLEIVGNMKHAQAFARQQANKDTGIHILTNTENNRLEDDAQDEEDDGQRRRKQPKKIPGKGSLDQEGIFQIHPLKIILHIYDDEVSDPKPVKLVTLRFEYLLKLNVVCVMIEGSHEGPENKMLCNLFPDDTGLELPHQAAKLSAGDAVAFDEGRTARPYKWAQHLAGIDFLPDVSPLLASCETPNSDTFKNSDIIYGLSLYRQQNRVQTVVQRIRSRKKAQLALPIWYTKVTDRECKEDGELMYLVPVPALINDAKLTASKGADLEHSRCLALISKSVIPPISKRKPQSFRENDEGSDLLLDTESDLDEPEQIKAGTKNAASIGCYEVVENSWVDYSSVWSSRRMDTNERTIKLKAKIKISMKYPLSSPLFILSLYTTTMVENSSEKDDSEWYNELRAVEAEVNLHFLKMLPWDHENHILARQICCLAMLFDFYIDEASKKKSASVVNVDLCKPVSGQILVRSFRGRDRRKMISWKDMECSWLSLIPY